MYYKYLNVQNVSGHLPKKTDVGQVFGPQLTEQI